MVIQERYLDRSSLALNEYLKEVSRIPLLSAEDELKYAKLAIEGDEIAREVLVKSNLRFVISVAKQYASKSVSVGDLINEGNIGLIEATHTYDPTRGFKFISFAVWNIKSKVINYLRSYQNIYDIPSNKVSSISKMKKLIGQLETELCREVYPEDLYDNFGGMSNNEIDTVYGLIKYRSVSTSQSIGGEDSITLGETLESDSYDDILSLENSEFTIQTLTDLVNKLDTRFRNLMNDCYGFNGKEKIGKNGYAIKHNLTPNRVRELHALAIRHLKLIASGKKVKPKEPTKGYAMEKLGKNYSKLISEKESISKHERMGDIMEKHVSPDSKMEINDKPMSENREDIDKMIEETDYVIKEEVAEKKSGGFMGLIKSIFN